MTADPHAANKLSFYREILCWIESKPSCANFSRWKEWSEARIPMLEEEVRDRVDGVLPQIPYDLQRGDFTPPQ